MNGVPENSTGDSNQDHRPVPDPTVLTTQALNQAIVAAKEISAKENSALKELVFEKFKAVNERFKDSKEAVSKAENATEKRFDEIDKSRKAQYDLINQAVPKSEYSVAQKAMDEKIDGLADRMNRNEGQGLGLRQGWGYLVAGIATVITIITFFSTR